MSGGVEANLSAGGQELVGSVRIGLGRSVGGRKVGGSIGYYGKVGRWKRDKGLRKRG